jgi:hypothetical protein
MASLFSLGSWGDRASSPAIPRSLSGHELPILIKPQAFGAFITPFKLDHFGVLHRNLYKKGGRQMTGLPSLSQNKHNNIIIIMKLDANSRVTSSDLHKHLSHHSDALPLSKLMSLQSHKYTPNFLIYHQKFSIMADRNLSIVVFLKLSAIGTLLLGSQTSGHYLLESSRLVSCLKVKVTFNLTFCPSEAGRFWCEVPSRDLLQIAASI